jgi:hypothetical protein
MRLGFFDCEPVVRLLNSKSELRKCCSRAPTLPATEIGIVSAAALPQFKISKTNISVANVAQRTRKLLISFLGLHGGGLVKIN